MSISKELRMAALKTEAVSRMYLLGLDPDVIKLFRDFGEVTVSDSSIQGFREPNDIEADLIRSVEIYGNCLIYHKLCHYEDKDHRTDYYLYVDDACCNLSGPCFAVKNNDQKATIHYGLAVRENERKYMGDPFDFAYQIEPDWKVDGSHICEGIVSACKVDPFTGNVDKEADFVYGTTKDGVLEFIA